MADEKKPQVRVTLDWSDEKPWRMDCDLCPGAVFRFYARHWAVAAADHHSLICPNAPEAVAGDS